MIESLIPDTKPSRAAFILLDGSQSMEQHWGETLSSLNTFADALGKEDPEFPITVVVFSSGPPRSLPLRDAVPAVSFKPLTPDEVRPSGGTPLYDSIVGICTKAIGHGAAKTQVVIITDGEENSSRQHNRDGARRALDQCRGFGWDVVFLGADFENFAQGAAVGNAYATTAKMEKGAYAGTMAAMAVRASAYASGTIAANSELGAVRAAASGKVG